MILARNAVSEGLVGLELFPRESLIWWASCAGRGGRLQCLPQRALHRLQESSHVLTADLQSDERSKRGDDGSGATVDDLTVEVTHHCFRHIVFPEVSHQVQPMFKESAVRLYPWEGVSRKNSRTLKNHQFFSLKTALVCLLVLMWWIDRLSLPTHSQGTSRPRVPGKSQGCGYFKQTSKQQQTLALIVKNLTVNSSLKI